LSQRLAELYAGVLRGRVPAPADTMEATAP
jgi:hypothetical protein